MQSPPALPFARPAAVVFDLDGTLVDSAPDLCGALNRLLVEHGRTPIELAQVRLMVGDGAATMIRHGFSVRDGAAVDPATLLPRYLEIYHEAIAELSRPFEGVTEALTLLAAHGVKLGVCTNKSTFGARKLLDALDLTRHFKCVTGGDGPARKPDPAHIHAVLNELGVAPADAVMVGDSIYDIKAAKAAGVRSVAVTFGYTHIPPRELGADAVIEKFGDLPATLGFGRAAL